MISQEANKAEMEAKRPEESRIILSQVMGPSLANSLGNIHGGVVMKLCDEAGGLAATRHAGRPAVTVNVDTMRFLSPVHVGDLLNINAVVTWVGRTSIETKIHVQAENVRTGAITHTNTAFFVFVALDDNGRPAEVPPLKCETVEEKAAFERAKKRRNLRLKLAAEE
ncbi:MAG: acyl-CoA thioesterase [Chloroflexota bacterium]